jgi:ribokinase
MPRIVVLGSFNMDLVVFTPRLPGPGETVLGTDFVRGPGGKGSNQAIAAARLGADVAFIGAVGADSFGDEARSRHEAEGIDTAHLLAVDRPTGVALIMVDDEGENVIAVAPGANSAITPDRVRASSDVIAAADVLLGQLEVPIESFRTAASIASHAGTTVVLNPAPAAPLPNDLWPLIDVITPNEHELLELAGSAPMEWAATELRSRGDIDVVVTRGPLGVLWTGSDGARHLPAIRAEAIDTTGAGDAFNAGLAVGLAETGSLEAGIELGLRAGAHAVTRRGVLDGLATREQLDRIFPA